jgi:hypothetical protein
MGLLTFIKEAGEKLFGKRDAQAAPAAPAPATPDPAATNRAAADAILAYVKAQNLPAIGISVSFDGASGTVKVAGSVPDQESKEKIILCCGNVAGVEHVEEEIIVETVEPEAEFYTVQKGDNLSKISKMHYGLRGEQADAEAPGQDLPGTDVAHSAVVGHCLGFPDPFDRKDSTLDEAEHPSGVAADDAVREARPHRDRHHQPARGDERVHPRHAARDGRRLP